MCSVLSDQELNRVNELTEHIIVPADDIICEEGETAESIFNIVSGCLRVSKMLSDGRRQIIGFLFPGDYFGLAGREGYSYSAESITDLELCQMPREQLFFKLQEYPKNDYYLHGLNKAIDRRITVYRMDLSQHPSDPSATSAKRLRRAAAAATVTSNNNRPRGILKHSSSWRDTDEAENRSPSISWYISP